LRARQNQLTVPTWCESAAVSAKRTLNSSDLAI
jgi:hypothetical protein